MDRDHIKMGRVEDTLGEQKAPLSESEKFNEATSREQRVMSKGLVCDNEGDGTWSRKGTGPALTGLAGMYRHRQRRQLRIVTRAMNKGRVRTCRFDGPYANTYTEPRMEFFTNREGVTVPLEVPLEA